MNAKLRRTKFVRGTGLCAGALLGLGLLTAQPAAAQTRFIAVPVNTVMPGRFAVFPNNGLLVPGPRPGFNGTIIVDGIPLEPGFSVFPPSLAGRVPTGPISTPFGRPALVRPLVTPAMQRLAAVGNPMLNRGGFGAGLNTGFPSAVALNQARNSAFANSQMRIAAPMAFGSPGMGQMRVQPVPFATTTGSFGATRSIGFGAASALR